MEANSTNIDANVSVITAINAGVGNNSIGVENVLAIRVANNYLKGIE